MLAATRSSTGSLEVVAAWDATSEAMAALEAYSRRAMEDSDARAAAEADGTGRSPGRSGLRQQRRRQALGKKRTTAEQVLEEVHRIAKERARGLTLDTSILELGLDSLERMEILAAIEERSAAGFPEEIAAAIGDLPRRGRRRRESSPQTKTDEADSGPTSPPEDYRFDRFKEYITLKQNLEMLEASGLGQSRTSTSISA